jgi:hypothetical protein
MTLLCSSHLTDSLIMNSKLKSVAHTHTLEVDSSSLSLSLSFSHCKTAHTLYFSTPAWTFSLPLYYCLYSYKYPLPYLASFLSLSHSFLHSLLFLFLLISLLLYLSPSFPPSLSISLHLSLSHISPSNSLPIYHIYSALAFLQLKNQMWPISWLYRNPQTQSAWQSSGAS